MERVVKIERQEAFNAYQKAILNCYGAGEAYCRRQLEMAKRAILTAEHQNEGVPDEWLAVQLASEHAIEFLSGKAEVGSIVVECGTNRFAFTLEVA